MGWSRPRDRATRVFGFPDIHWGIRDPRALRVAERAFTYFSPDLAVIGGDLLDCGPFSGHRRIKMIESVGQDWIETELKPAKAWLDSIKERVSYLAFLEGNHEEWVERFCANLGPAGAAIYPLISPRTVLSRGWPKGTYTYVPFTKTKGQVGGAFTLSPQLMCVHGWSTCKHAAAKHLELSRTRSVIFHHTHRAQTAVSRDPWSGRLIEAVSAGCLCKLQPIYMHGGHPSDWTHGFWVAYVGRRSYTAYPVQIKGGTAVLPDGKEIRL